MYMLQLPPNLKISPRFSLRPDIFKLQAILRQVHWMFPKWPWTLEVQTYPHILMLTTPEFQISLGFEFALQLAVLSYNPYETSAPNDPKMTLNTKRSKVPDKHFTTFESHFFPLQNSHFWVTGHFGRIAPDDPKITLNSKSCKVPHIHVATTPGSKCYPASLYGQLFSSYKPSWDKCTESPWNDLEH